MVRMSVTAYHTIDFRFLVQLQKNKAPNWPIRFTILLVWLAFDWSFCFSMSAQATWNWPAQLKSVLPVTHCVLHAVLSAICYKCFCVHFRCVSVCCFNSTMQYLCFTNVCCFLLCYMLRVIYNVLYTCTPCHSCTCTPRSYSAECSMLHFAGHILCTLHHMPIVSSHHVAIWPITSPPPPSSWSLGCWSRCIGQVRLHQASNVEGCSSGTLLLQCDR